MDEKLNTVISEYEKVTGKSADTAPPVNENEIPTITAPSSLFKFSIPKSKYQVILYLFLGIFIFLLVVRPSFCLTWDKQKEHRILSYTRVATCTVILTAALLVAFYVYKSKVKSA